MPTSICSAFAVSLSCYQLTVITETDVQISLFQTSQDQIHWRVSSEVAGRSPQRAHINARGNHECMR